MSCDCWFQRVAKTTISFNLISFFVVSMFSWVKAGKDSTTNPHQKRIFSHNNYKYSFYCKIIFRVCSFSVMFPPVAGHMRIKYIPAVRLSLLKEIV